MTEQEIAAELANCPNVPADKAPVLAAWIASLVA